MLRKAITSFFSALVIGLAVGAPASAAPTAFFAAGNTCAGAATQSFSTSGPIVQIALCASTPATEGICGFSVSFQAANAGESGVFKVNNRSVAPYDPNNGAASLAAFSKGGAQVLEEEIDSSLGFLRHDFPEAVYSELRNSSATLYTNNMTSVSWPKN